MSVDGMEPTTAEVYQDELSEFPAAPVRHIGPVKVQQMGAMGWSADSLTIDNTVDAQPVRIFNKNPRRSRAMISNEAGTLYVASTQEGARLQRGFRMGSGSAATIVLTHTEEVWVKLIGGPSMVGILEEFWTE